MIDVECPNCKKIYRVTSEIRASKLRCHHCGHAFRTDGNSEGDSQESETYNLLPPAPRRTVKQGRRGGLPRSKKGSPNKTASQRKLRKKRYLNSYGYHLERIQKGENRTLRFLVASAGVAVIWGPIVIPVLIFGFVLSFAAAVIVLPEDASLGLITGVFLGLYSGIVLPTQWWILRRLKPFVVERSEKLYFIAGLGFLFLVIFFMIFVNIDYYFSGRF